MSGSLSTVILAGGQSSRMGQDKALLTFRGIPLLTHLIHQVLPLSNRILVLTPWPERYQAIAPNPCELIREALQPSTTQGPLVAFAQGLTQFLPLNTQAPVTTESWVLLLACDLPLLTTQALQTWITQLPQVSASAIACLPKSPKGWEPLCGFYRLSCRSHLNTYLQTGGRSFQGWLRQESVEELTISDRQVLFNCNTPEDWQQAVPFNAEDCDSQPTNPSLRDEN